MGSDYTGFGLGPVIFFLICAISSVSWLSLAMIVAVKGIAIVEEKKSKFKTLFFVAASFAAFFFFAVMKYEWLGGNTEYDGMYHSIGYIGSMIIALVVVSTARSYHVKTSGKIISLSFGVPLLFLVINSTLFTGSFTGSSSSSNAYFIGFLYASIQFVLPLLYYFYINKPENKQIAMMERDAWINGAKMGKQTESQIIPNPSSATPVNVTAPAINSQPELGDVIQNPDNRQ